MPRDANTPTMTRTNLFLLPPKGSLTPNTPDDPLPYYYKPLVGWFFKKRIEQALALLNPPFKSVLEVGYGSGILLPSLAQMADRVTGVDLASDPEVVGANLRRLGVQCHLIKGNLLEVTFDKEGFDLIVAISVLEHIQDLEPVFERLHELLTPSGYLLVGMPRVDKFMEKAFASIGFKGIEQHHVTTYKMCIEAATPWFRLVKRAHLVPWLPEWAGLYFNMLFQKK